MQDKAKLVLIQKTIGYQFNNENLLQQAFTRKSFASLNKKQNNEVLEFYGDRILNFIVIKEFYNKYGSIDNNFELVSSKNVKELSNCNVEMIRNTTLAQQIVNLKFTNFIRVRYKTERKSIKYRADLFEAILGAVALDSNWNIVSLETVYRNMMKGYDEISTEKSKHYTPGSGILKLILYRYEMNNG